MKSSNITRTFTLLVLAATMLTACKKEKPTTSAINIVQGEGVFIGNEGAFNGGNAEVMYYKIGSNSATTDLYSQVNSEPLGDVLQSMFIDGAALYLVVNNSQKIESVQLPSFNKLNTLTGFMSPRYMIKTNTQTAFVSDLFSNTISRVAMGQNTINGNITLPTWTEQMLFHDSKLFVTAPLTDKLYVCDPVALQVADSIMIGKGSNSIVLDKDGMLWVFCGGESWNNIDPKLVKINPATHQVVSTFNLPAAGNPIGRLCSNASSDTLYYISDDVYRMSIYDAALQPSFIGANGRNLYGLYRHPSQSKVFVTDAKDFAQKGDVAIYSTEGILEKTIQVGIAPSQVLVY